jgi:hypothetical protein
MWWLSPPLARCCGCVSVSAETVSGLKAILGGLSLGQGNLLPMQDVLRLGRFNQEPAGPGEPSVGVLNERDGPSAAGRER